MDLILLRHLAPTGGEGRCYGRTDLAPGPGLDAGAARLARRLPRPARIVTSPLRRCRTLARRLGARFRVPVTVAPGWTEIDFGAWETLPWDQVPRAELDAWAADLLHARAHGGESVAMLLARTRRALVRTPRGSLVVTHAGPIRAALVATGAGASGWSRRIGFGEAVAILRG
ncbi:MAG: histidine phosphatase family protein [Amaricoccus sp.]|uniref:histidine phosphatase family protein n=1 Tax=Amaricoccus sp. TaxID=1872485 RepID=UPI0039E4C28B